MSTTKTTKRNDVFINLCDDKIAELTKKIATTKTSDVLTKNTRGTQLYKLGRERRTVALIKELLSIADNNTTLSDASISTLNLLVGEHPTAVSFSVSQGDKLIDILEKYKDVKDVYGKLMKFCDKEGLKLVDGVITDSHKEE